MISKLSKRLKENNFIKSILTLASGIAIAQGINFLGMPVISRLYDPAAIGDYTLITANSAVIMSIVTLGMMTVFLLPKTDDEARGLSKLVATSTIVFSAIIIIILFLLSGAFKIFSTESIPYGISLIVLWVYIVVYTINNICYAFLNRRKLYKVMFWNPIIGVSANIIVGIIFGIFEWGFIGYTAAHIIGFIFNIIHLIIFANPFKKTTNPDYKFMPLLREYSRFPKFQMPANLVGNIAIQMPIQMIGLVFGGAALGLYSMSHKILALPAILLATPINRVYFKEASDRYNNNQDIGEFTFKILKANIKIALIPIVILIIFGEELFAFILGEAWRQAGEIAAIIGVYELIKFCTMSLSGGLVILGKNKINLLMSIITAVVNSIIFLVVAMFLKDDFMLAIWAVAISGFIINAISLGVFLCFANVKIREYVFFIMLNIIIPYSIAFSIKVIIFN